MLSQIFGDAVDQLTRGLSYANDRKSALRDPFATYRATCDLVSIGAYASGSDPRIERALLARLRQPVSPARAS